MHAESRGGGDKYFPKIASKQKEGSAGETGLEMLMPPGSKATVRGTSLGPESVG
jgi:hypothetical protein